MLAKAFCLLAVGLHEQSDASRHVGYLNKAARFRNRTRPGHGTLPGIRCYARTQPLKAFTSSLNGVPALDGESTSEKIMRAYVAVHGYTPPTLAFPFPIWPQESVCGTMSIEMAPHPAGGVRPGKARVFALVRLCPESQPLGTSIRGYSGQWT